MTKTTEEQIIQIHREFHSMMNGPVSQSMREKGLKYKVIFGVELPRLMAFAATLPHTRELAQALWKENIRESRIIAPMLMPTEEFCPEMADIWLEQANYAEEVQCCVMYLFQRLPYAPQKAFEWMADERPTFQMCGFQLIARLFANGTEATPRGEEEFLDQAAAALRSEDFHVRKAAHTAVLKFMDINLRCERRGDSLLTDAGL